MRANQERHARKHDQHLSGRGAQDRVAYARATEHRPWGAWAAVGGASQRRRTGNVEFGEAAVGFAGGGAVAVAVAAVVRVRAAAAG